MRRALSLNWNPAHLIGMASLGDGSPSQLVTGPFVTLRLGVDCPRCGCFSNKTENNQPSGFRLGIGLQGAGWCAGPAIFGSFPAGSKSQNCCGLWYTSRSRLRKAPWRVPMPAEPLSPEISLPRGWLSCVRTAVLHVNSLAQFTLAYPRGWTVNSSNSRMRLKVELDRVCKWSQNSLDQRSPFYSLGVAVGKPSADFFQELGAFLQEYLALLPRLLGTSGNLPPRFFEIDDALRLRQ